MGEVELVSQLTSDLEGLVGEVERALELSFGAVDGGQVVVREGDPTWVVECFAFFETL